MGRRGFGSTGAALAGLALLVTGCTPRNDAAEKPVESPAPAPPPVAPAPVIPAPAAPLGRAELLQIVSAASSAFAAGTPEPEAAKDLAGRRFTLKLPFGCGRPAPEEAVIGYTYDAKAKALRIRARPEAWSEAEWVTRLVGTDETEAIEGFWIRRPWLTSEGCPAWAASAPANPASPETLGLVQVFKKGGSRVLRRGERGYLATVKREAEAAPGPAGLRLVLEGRIGPADVRGPLRCRSDSPNQRPTCLLIVELDRVAFETPEGEMLSEWRS